jgi:hypothetical protein
MIDSGEVPRSLTIELGGVEAQARADLVGVDLGAGAWTDPALGKVRLADWLQAWWATTTTCGRPPAPATRACCAATPSPVR